MEKFIIYKWLNLKNGKVYIGQTGNFIARKSAYLSGKAGAGNSHLRGAFRKYGLRSNLS